MQYISDNYNACFDNNVVFVLGEIRRRDADVVVDGDSASKAKRKGTEKNNQFFLLKQRTKAIVPFHVSFYNN